MEYETLDKELPDWQNAGSSYWLNADYAQVNMCIMKQAEVNRKGIDGYRPLHKAARFCHDPEVITLLIKCGAEVDAETNYKRTPLHLAAYYNSYPKIINALLDGKANINAQDIEGSTPLHLAVKLNGNLPNMIMALLNKGADCNITDKLGRVPFKYVENYLPLDKKSEAYKLLKERTNN